MPLVEGLRLMAKAAHLDYERGVSEAEITAQLDYSQSPISHLLQQALNQKIVQNSVTLVAGFHAHLKDELQKKSNLGAVTVVEI